MRYHPIMCVLLLFAAVLLPPVHADAPKPVLTLEASYLGLSMGPLRDARLVTLPKGTVLRAGAVTLTEQQVTAEIARAKPDMQVKLKKNRVYVMEELAIRPLLLGEAKAWAKETGWKGKATDERALLKAYLDSLVEKISVTDEELKAYYEENKEMVGGADYDTVAKDMRAYLLEEKRQQAVNEHVQTLSARMTVELDAAWVAAQAKTALDNAVDQARRAGKPALIDFGAEGCRACDMMAPLLKELKETYSEQCAVHIINVRHEPMLAARYGIQSIPVQVFFDKDGKEVFRHVGFFPKAEMLAKLAELGVK